MKAEKVRLFIKPYCGWCHEAMDWLSARQVPYEVLDVTSDPAAGKEMVRLSGQTLAPVIEVDGGDTSVMDRVVGAAAELAQPGDTVLLAPGCASMDMFANYGARGDAFAESVRRLGGR